MRLLTPCVHPTSSKGRRASLGIMEQMLPFFWLRLCRSRRLQLLPHMVIILLTSNLFFVFCCLFCIPATVAAAPGKTAFSSLLVGHGTSYPGLESLPAFPNDTYLDRTWFPPGFVFGSLTLAVKHEGAAVGKIDSIWDFYARINGTVLDGTLPGNAGDQYNRYEEDIEAMALLGMDAFRFSFPWTRILPDRSGAPNMQAVDHYNALINKLIEHGIEPHVTLWAEDHPQALEDAYGGLLSTFFIEDFVAYANVCFAAFGDRVRYWTTFDKPNDYAALAYAASRSPPGRCTPGYSLYGSCNAGNSSTEPYLVAHNLLLSHAAVAKLYNSIYKVSQRGQIGIALWFEWYEPLNVSDLADVEAARRAQDFHFGWFMDPLESGRYPESMRTMLGTRLPRFSEDEAADLVNSWDFLGLEVATARYVYNQPFDDENLTTGFFEDMRAGKTAYRDGVAIGEFDHEYSVPWCFERIIQYMQNNYGNPPMYIAETGWGTDYSPSLEESLNDTGRVQIFCSYYLSLSEAIRRGGNVLGVFAWSFIDGFEVFMGLTRRFGLFYVDEDMTRYPRLSAFWFQQLLRSKFNILQSRPT